MKHYCGYYQFLFFEAPTFDRDSEKREESADEIPDFEPQDGTREEPDELNGDLNLIQRICWWDAEYSILSNKNQGLHII